MTTRTWRTAGTSAVLALSLLTAACAGAPQARDELATSPTTAPISTPAPAPPTSPAPTTTELAGPPLSYVAKATESALGDCELFPPDHFLNATNVDRLPVHPRSVQWTSFLARGGQRFDPPSSTIWAGARGGMPINVVNSNDPDTNMVNVLLDHSYGTNNWTGQYPIPSNPRLEGYPSAQWDKHLLIVDEADCTAYELIQYDELLGRVLGIHKAMSGVKYSLRTTERPLKTTNAAKTPMIGQYAMVDEANAGRIAHALGFCTTALSSDHIWPAGKSDGLLTSPDAPPMGAWLRLKGNVDRTRFTGQARAIVDALRHHGMILTDTCGHQLNLMAENSSGWNKAQMDQLKQLTALHFEVVDARPMVRSTASFRVN